MLIPWAGIKMRDDGTNIATDRCSGVRTAQGDYTITLDNALGEASECFPVSSLWVPPSLPIFKAVADHSLSSDGVTLTVRWYDLDSTPIGLPIDVNFVTLVFRNAP